MGKGGERNTGASARLTPDERRKSRLAAALKANLARRKAQARDRDDANPDNDIDGQGER